MTTEEKRAYEHSHRVYLETQRRKTELPEEDRKLLEKVLAIETGRYGVNCSTALMIAKVYDNNAINAFCAIFNLGFMKGERSMKNRMKRGVKNGKAD